MVALQGAAGGLHENVWLSSLLLCLMDVSGVANMAAWLPIYVTLPVLQRVMMNMRRRERRQTKIWVDAGWKFQRIYYGALFALLTEGLIDGEILRCSGGNGSTVVEDWYSDAFLVAVSLGFLKNCIPSLSSFSRVSLCMWSRNAMTDTEFRDLMGVLPRFMENPTALLEKMWYMAGYWRLMRHCCYCRYGAAWKKPTTFWVINMDWEDPLMCYKRGEQCEARRLNEGVHPVCIGGDANHSMADKWHVPFDLCLCLLRQMRKRRVGGRWFLTLFGGAGSFDRPCDVCFTSKPRLE